MTTSNTKHETDIFGFDYFVTTIRDDEGNEHRGVGNTEELAEERASEKYNEENQS